MKRQKKWSVGFLVGVWLLNPWSIVLAQGGPVAGVISRIHNKRISQLKAYCPRSLQSWGYRLAAYGSIEQSRISGCRVGLEIEVCSTERPPGELKFVPTVNARPQECPAAEIITTSKLYEKNSEDEFSIPVEHSSKLWNLSTVIFTLGEDPSTVELRFGPLPNKPTTENQQVMLMPGCNGQGSSSGIKATVKVGMDHGSVGIDQDQLEALKQARCLSAIFPDKSSFMQRDLSVKLDGQDVYKIDFKWEKTRIDVKDAVSDKKVKDVTIQPIDFKDACKVKVDGMTVEYLEDCNPKVRISADAYQPEEVGLMKVSTPVKLWPNQTDIVVDLSGIPDGIQYSFSDDEGSRILENGMPLSLESQRYHEVLQNGLEVTVLGKPVRIPVKPIKHGYRLDPVTRGPVRASSFPCSEDLGDAEVEVRVGEHLLWKGKSGKEATFLHGLEHTVTAKMDGYEPATKKYQPTAAPSLTLSIDSKELTRTFRVELVNPFCGGKRVVQRQFGLIFAGEPVETDDQGEFRLRRPLDAKNLDVWFEDTDAPHLFKDSEIKPTLRIDRWNDPHKACNTAIIPIVRSQVERSFKAVRLDACSNENGIAEPGVNFQVGGETLTSNADGTFHFSRRWDARDVSVKVADTAAWEMVKDGRTVERIPVGHWTDRRASCSSMELLLRPRPKAGSEDLELLTFEKPLSPKDLASDHFKIALYDQCDRRKVDFKPDQLEIRDGKLVLPGKNYTTLDKRVEIAWKNDRRFESVSMTAFDLASPRGPLALRARRPGVLLMISATSRLAETYPTLVDPLVEFLDRETDDNNKVLLAYSFGRDLIKDVKLEPNMSQEEIRRSLEVRIEIESTPYPVNDIADAQNKLKIYNSEIPDYKNKLLYVVPSDPICRLVRREALENYLQGMEVTVFEIKPPNGYKEGVCLKDVPQIKHLYVTIEELSSYLEETAK